VAQLKASKAWLKKRGAMDNRLPDDLIDEEEWKSRQLKGLSDELGEIDAKKRRRAEWMTDGSPRRGGAMGDDVMY